MKLLLLGCFAIIQSISAQTITAPPQPATGPGGTDYVYRGSPTRFGLYSPVNNPYGMPGEYYIFEPSTAPANTKLPVVLFLHGYLLGIDPVNGDGPGYYLGWITQIVKMGYTVVYPLYAGTHTPTSQFSAIIENAWSDALNKLQSCGNSCNGLIPPSRDASGNIKTGFVGHSMGAIQALTIAQDYSEGIGNPGDFPPIPKAVVAITPGLGNVQPLLPIDFSNMSMSVKLILVKGDADTTQDQQTADTIWSLLPYVQPLDNADYLEAISDDYGTPDLSGDHWFPLTVAVNDPSAIDDRDFNITYKLSVGLLNCATLNTDCSFGLGHGSADEVGMGNWSDGKAAKPLVYTPVRN